ncbi:hypothetical protein DFH06DRAFT_1231658 [Mycena polygramma]|nr:hypothetical protein DFH06DRAFT_1231658 [Mycena polygramma]
MKSPFGNILCTNRVPSDAECSSIHDLVQGWRKELSPVNEEVARLNSLLHAVTPHRDELQRCIDDHLALVSPVRRCPDDIIHEIFMAALPPRRNSSLDAREAPLLLCKICSSWRTIALSTPRLWASIHIVLPAPSRVPRLVAVVITWLNRSGTVPIDVSMACSPAADARCDILPLMSALVTLAPRWRHMNLPMVTYSYLASLSSKDVPLLQTMALKIQPESDDSPEDALELLATGTLRRLELPVYKPLLRSRALSWGTLLHLKLTMYRQLLPTHVSVLRILGQCPLLETCDVPVSGGHPSPQYEPLALPHLRRLSIANGRTPLDVFHFVGSLILPALSCFRCSDYIIAPKIFTSRSLFPSAPFLQDLWVNIRGMRTDVLLAALTELPTLLELHILQEPVNVVDGDPDSEFLAHLIPPQMLTAAICPLLHHLALENFNALADDTLLRFIQSRTAPVVEYVEVQRGNNFESVVSLSRFSCSFQRPRDRDILPELHDAIAAGLVLELQYRKNVEDAYSPLDGIDTDA